MSLRRSGFLALALVLAAGCKEVSKRAPVQTVYLAAFDPGTGTVPLPNDLGLQAAPGQAPASIPRNLLFTFIGGGGWPGDQVITVPIRTISYDAAANKYVNSPTPAPGIEAASVNAQTVAIVRVSDSPPTVLTPQFLGYGPDSVNPAIGVLRIRPVEGLAVGRYVVAVRGGASGVKTTDGQPISADQVIALLAPNKDLANPENQPIGGLTPAQVVQLEQVHATFAHGWTWGAPPDPATRLATCVGALGLPAPAALPEGTCWLPLAVSTTTADAYTGIDLVFGHADAASMQTFNVASPAVVADTSAGVLPFPSDFLLDPATPVPHKVRNIPALGPAAAGLATLDGFSTTGLMLVPLSAPADVSTFPGHVLLYDLAMGLRRMHFAGPAPTAIEASEASPPPEYWLEPTNLVRSVGGLQVSTAIGLQPGVPFPLSATSVAPLPPLASKNRYLVVVTKGVTDVAGHPLVRGTLGNLLLSDLQTEPFSGGHSNVPGVSDTDAAALQQLRDALRSVLLPGATLLGDIASPSDVVMAYTVTTQDVKTISGQLTALPYKVDAIPGMGLRTSAPTVFDATAAPYGIPSAATPNVKEFLSTTVTSLDILDPLNGALNASLLGVLAEDPATWDAAAVAAVTGARHEIPVLFAVPRVAVTCTPLAPCGVPMVVFHHGIFGSRFQMLAIADSLAAKGFAVAAIDAPFHGDRAFCETNADCNGGTCTLDAANQAAPGTCTGGTGLAFDSSRLTTVASGNYFISSNFFRIRDVVREDLFDQSALVLALSRSPLAPPLEPITQRLIAADGVFVNPPQIYFAGVSLGGMIGTSLVATNPRISRATLTVAGGTLTDIFTNSPSFAPQITPLFSQLIPGFTTDKVNPASPLYDPIVAQAYAQALIVAKWVLDPAESVNYAADVTIKDAADPTLLATLTGLGVGFNTAAVYGQFIQDDQVVPNAFSVELYGNAGAPPPIPFTLYTADATALPDAQRHGVLYAPNAFGNTVRTDLANFLENTSVVPTSPKVLP
jgi:alpha-beta hydrolase superfamily lysophospholipase